MAIGHLAVRVHSRGNGRSTAAGLAYRHGAELVDKTTGEVHDYRKRVRGDSADVLEWGVESPSRWKGLDDLQYLADRIEEAEKRKDSQLFRDVQIALPHELDDSRRIDLCIHFARLLTYRYDTPAAWAIHGPHSLKKKKYRRNRSYSERMDEDVRNIHVHISLPTRALDSSGEAFAAKLTNLSDWPEGPREIAFMRNTWQDMANKNLEEAGIDARVHVGKRLDGPPEPTLPRTASVAMRKSHRKRVMQFRAEAARLGREPKYAPRAIARVGQG